MKKKIILSSALTMVMAASILVGASYALFTSEDKTDITVSSGNVEVVSTVDEGSLKTESMGKANIGATFANGGSISIVDGKNVILDKVTPGDKAEFTINVANHSNVAAKFRAKIAVVSGYTLYSGLIVDCNKYAVWTSMTPAIDESTPTNISIPVSIELPENAGNEYKNETAELSLIVEAVQGNAIVHDDKIVDTKTESTNEVIFEEVSEENVEVASNNEAVRVSFPKANANPDADKAVLTVSNPTIEDKANFKIAQGEDAVYYDIDVTGVNTEAGPVEVTLYAGKGLENVSVQHNKGMDGIETITDVDYNPLTGFVTFKTNSFSAFAIITPKIYNVPAEGTALENGAALTAVIERAGDNAIIKLAKGQYESDGKYQGFTFNRNITLVGVGTKTILSYTMNGCCTIFSNKHLTLKNLRIAGTYDTLKDSLNEGMIRAFGSEGCIDTYNVSYQFVNASGKKCSGYNPIKIDLNEEEYICAVGGTNLVMNTAADSYRIISEKYAEIAIQQKYNNDVTLQNDVYITIGSAGGLEYGIKLDTYNNQDIQINLNGKNVRFAYSNKLLNEKVAAESEPTVYSMMIIWNDNKVTINGEGTIDGTIDNAISSYIFTLGTYPTYPRTGYVVINSGNYYGGTSVVQADKGTCEINGGHFDLPQNFKNPEDPAKEATYLLNGLAAGYDSGVAKFIVKGGEFVNFNPAESHSENKKPVSFLPETGYQSTPSDHNGEKWYTVSAVA